MYQNLINQTKPSNFDIFCRISWDPMHIFQNRFLRWNPELKPNVLSIIKPMNRTKIFLTYNGPSRIKKANWGGLKLLQFSSNFNCELIIYIVMGKWFAINDFQHIWFFEPPYTDTYVGKLSRYLMVTYIKLGTLREISKF